MLHKLPNALSIVRTLMVPLLVYLMILDDRSPNNDYAFTCALIFFLAGLTDTFDGWLARKLDAVSRMGKLIDPLADKIIVLGALVMLASMQRIEAWVVVAIMAREVAVNSLRMLAVTEGVLIQSTKGGKVKTFVQFAGIDMMLLYHPYWNIPVKEIGVWCVYVSAIIAWWSGIVYFVRYLRAEPASVAP